MCPTSSYRELQQKLRKSFQKKFENANKDKNTCLHPCDFPHCIENCRYALNQEHQFHRCDRHQVIPKAYSQQLWLPESSSAPKMKKETFVSADKDTYQPRKYNTRRNMHVKLTGNVQGKSLKDLNKALLECLEDFKWPLSTKKISCFRTR